MSITILLLGREYALVDKGLPKQGSLLHHPQTMHYRQITQKKYLLHMCVLKDSPEKYGSYFCWPQEQLEQKQHLAAWKLPRLHLGLVEDFRQLPWWALPGFQMVSILGIIYIDQWADVYIYIRIFTYHIYIYCNIVYIICIYVLILIIR